MSFSVTKGFAVAAGTVVLIASASHAAAIGAANYAAEYVREVMRLGRTFTRGVHVVHRIPLLIGGTCNTPAIRAIAEIEQWVKSTSSDTNSISACNTCNLCKEHPHKQNLHRSTTYYQAIGLTEQQREGHFHHQGFW
jgi:hypothetical protein